MFQLVQKNKRGILLTIAGFLVAGVIVLVVLKFTLAPAPVNRQLDSYANSINKRCPMVIDSVITLNNIFAVSGNRLHYNYTMAVNKEEVDTGMFQSAVKEQLINKLRTDPSVAFLNIYRVALSATYYDTTGKYICKIAVDPADVK